MSTTYPVLLPCNRIGVCSFHIYFVVVCFIVIYGYYLRHTGEEDVLQRKFARCEGCDYWAVTHFTMNFILGYTFPTHLLTFWYLGVGYEVLEQLLGYLPTNHLVGPVEWWYGRVSDVLFNTTGLVLGATLATW